MSQLIQGNDVTESGMPESGQDQLATSQGRVLLNMIAVYRALGGGWQIRCPEYQRHPASDNSEQVPEGEMLPTPAGASATGRTRRIADWRSRTTSVA